MKSEAENLIVSSDDPALDLQRRAEKAAIGFDTIAAQLMPEALALVEYAVTKESEPRQYRLACITGAIDRYRYLDALAVEIRRLCIAVGAANPNRADVSESGAYIIQEFQENAPRWLGISAETHDSLRRMIARDEAWKAAFEQRPDELENAGQTAAPLAETPVGESNNPDYTTGDMGNATGAFEAVAAERGLSVAELNEAIDNYTAARSELTARGITTRASDDTRLGRLQARYERRLREIELPERGFTTKAQSAAAHRLSSTLRDLQKVQAQLGLPVAEKPQQVKKAEAMYSAYYGSHDKTGAPIAVRPRGRPRRVELNSGVSVPP